MKLRPTQKLLLLPMLALAFLLASKVAGQLESANLTSVSVTLSNARPSFRGALAAGNTTGSSIVTINTTAGAFPSTSSAQLVEGDSLRIGEANSLGSYTVASTSSFSTFSLTGALAAGDADQHDDVIASTSATLTVRFTTVNAIANGRFRVLVPALSSDAASSDGIPDGGYFDFGASAPTVTCPGDVSSNVYDFVTGTATASTITINSVDYHSYECAYSGTGAVGTAFDGSSQGAITIASVINPAPKSGHTTGLADAHNIVVQQLDSSFAPIDATTTQVGTIEAVRVTASVAPQLTFQIIGVNTGTSACGVTTSAPTTPTAVQFGEIGISAFTNAAQALTVSTNAPNGYAVTAIANDQLGRNGATCSGDNTGVNCIRDTVGNGGAMTHSASAEWTNVSAKGFGYALHDANSSISNGSAEAFSYNTSSGNCTGTFCARQFADQEDSQSAVTVYSSNTVADNENLLVCYRIVAATTNAAGNYENNIRYTTTATF